MYLRTIGNIEVLYIISIPSLLGPFMYDVVYMNPGVTVSIQS